MILALLAAIDTTFPRLSALAEVLWTPREERNYADFRSQLDTHLQRLAVLDVGFRRP